MKKNQTISIALLFAILILPFTVTSCGGDDSSESPIVGKWSCSERCHLGTDTYTFNSNGTYQWSYSGGWSHGFSDHHGTYTFDGKILCTTRSNGMTDVQIVLGISESNMILMDEDGDSYSYRRQ